MKQVVSISLGSSRRDHETETLLLGEKIRIRRIGVDGDFARARKLFLELDGHVDAFGIGGCEIGINFAGRYYRLRAVQPLIAGLGSPVVDGAGVRGVVERKMGLFLKENLAELSSSLVQRPRVLFCVSAARYDMVKGFHSAGFETRFGDPGFILGLPYASTHFQLAQFAGRMIIPWVVRLPFSWLYPTGKKQEENRPRFQSWFDWADVIADDFHYIRRHLPLKIANKIIVTNTTTPADRKLLRQRGARYLVTTTPLLDGRSYGTNVFEAALTAAAGKSRSLTHAELSDAVREIGFQPNVVRLN